MTWSTKAKDISIASSTGHTSSKNGVRGRNLQANSITFTAAELFGATARCSHLQNVSLAASSPEFRMMKATIENHVDNVSGDFCLLQSVDRLKDFVRNYFVGTVAAGISYLTLIKEGYIWAGHFETLTAGAFATSKSPDFVFAGRDSSGLALLESKGTRRLNPRRFNNKVEDGYWDQVEPHLGSLIANGYATHGYCIGSRLTSNAKAELYIHHTAKTPVTRGFRSSRISRVQQQNYATAFLLSHGPALSQQVRNGEPPTQVRFIEFEWLGTTWLTGWQLRFLQSDLEIAANGNVVRTIRWSEWLSHGTILGFAIEKDSAIRILNEMSVGGTPREFEFQLVPIRDDLIETARGEENQAAIFPDGLAVISERCRLSRVRMVVWDRNSGQLSALD